jgi:hypothetical protein
MNQKGYKLPPPQTPGVISKFTGAYKLWQEYQQHIPRQQKYTLGTKIDLFFIEAIEGAVTASFLSKDQKPPFITKSIIKLDTLKFFLNLLWETKGMDTKKYVLLSKNLEEIGKMLGGWRNQLIKQNSPAFKAGEK